MSLQDQTRCADVLEADVASAWFNFLSPRLNRFEVAEELRDNNEQHTVSRSRLRCDLPRNWASSTVVDRYKTLVWSVPYRTSQSRHRNCILRSPDVAHLQLQFNRESHTGLLPCCGAVSCPLCPGRMQKPSISIATLKSAASFTKLLELPSIKPWRLGAWWVERNWEDEHAWGTKWMNNWIFIFQLKFPLENLSWFGMNKRLQWNHFKMWMCL